MRLFPPAKLLAAGALAVLAFSAHAQILVAAPVGPCWPGYGACGYGWAVPWSACAFGGCVDSPTLRRAIQRELQRWEQREADEAARRNQRFGPLPYAVAGGWPPPTPEAHIQPAYRRSGEIRPEFLASGEPR